MGLMMNSIAGPPRTLGTHSLGSGSDVYHRRYAYLRHYHRVRDVLSRRGRILIPISSRIGLMGVGRNEELD
jgi:hypothetical protein